MDAEAEAANLEVEIAEVCGILNVATGRLVSLIGRVLATESYAGAGIRSPEQWVAWKCGVSLGRGRTLVATVQHDGTSARSPTGGGTGRCMASTSGGPRRNDLSTPP